jgi:ribosome-binding protein aMBF1 (putative translation factor)
MKLREALKQVREEYYSRIKDAIVNSSNSYAEIARKEGVSENLVWGVARLNGLSRSKDKE